MVLDNFNSKLRAAEHPRCAGALYLAVVGGAYFLAHKISFFFPDAEKVLMAIWPAGGIGLAALLLSPRTRWPAILSVLFVAGNLANLTAGRPLLASLGYMTANVAESFACAWVIQRWCGEQVRFARVREIVLLLLAATLVNAATSFIGAATASLVSGASFWVFYKTWWVADALGILLMTPLVVCWATEWQNERPFSWFRFLEAILLVAAGCLFIWISFGISDSRASVYFRPYMFFGILAWIAFRCGPRSTVTLLALSAVITIRWTIIDDQHFPWKGHDKAEQLMMSEIFIGFSSIIGMLLAASREEQRAAVEKLQSSEAFLDRIIESSPTAKCVSDSHGTLIRTNAAFCHSMQVRNEEVVGKYNIFKDDVIEKQGLMPQVRSVFEEGKTVRFTLRYDTPMLRGLELKERPFVSLDVSISPVLDHQGRVRNAIIQHVDITAREQAEEELRLQSEVLSNMSEGVVLVRARDCSILLANPTFERMFGYAANELIGQSIAVINAPTDKSPEEIATAIVRQLEEKKSWSGEILNRKKDGSLLWCHASASAFTHSMHGVLWVALHTDITERKRMDQELKNQKEHYELLLRTSTDAIHIIDAKGNLLEWNEAFRQHLQYEPEELARLNVTDWDVRSNAEQIKAEIALQTQKGGRGDTTHRRKDGSIRHVEVVAASMRLRGENVVYASARDVTERKEAEALLRALYAQAEHDANTKAELLKEINHRVKNNLTSILGLLLKEQQHASAEGREYVEMALGRLTQRIRGLLQVHQLLSDTQWAPMRLNNLATLVIRGVLTAAPPHRQATLTVTPSTLNISPRQASSLALVINELATNTLKHALAKRPETNICFSAERDGDDIKIVYRDDGPGYPEAMLAATCDNLGLNLIHQLVTETLRGSIAFTNDGGAVATLRINIEETNRT